MRGTKVGYLGNFSVPFSTESHVAASLEDLGVTVLRIQEGRVPAIEIPELITRQRCDMFLWTQTYSLAEQGGTLAERTHMLDAIKVPSVAFHLDRWWGLSREGQVLAEPFFNCDFVFTADGGHDKEWNDAGVNHVWSPPGVFGRECKDSPRHPSFSSDVAFVGSWGGYGHPEWEPHRMALLDHLRSHYGRRFKTWPIRNKPAVRGMALNSLYASTKIVVGDSCLNGNVHHYWSDRIPETLGRGALIIHPEVDGLEPIHPGLPTFPLHDYDALCKLIDMFLGDDELRNSVRESNVAHTRSHNTYKHRMTDLLEHVLT